MSIEVFQTNCVAIQRQSLVDALKKLSLVINAKGSLEILKAVKFEITENEIVLIATDADSIAIVKMNNEYNCSPQSLVIGHKRLNEFLKKSKAPLIIMEKLDNDMVNLKASKVNFKMQGFCPFDFPTLPNLDFNFLEMDVTDFKNAMKNTLFACATTDSRPVLRTVNITYNSNHLQFVATDSHRLGQYTLDSYRTDLELKGNPVGEVLSKIVKLISKNEKKVVIGFHDNYMKVQFDDVEFYLRNVEGNYPQTDRLIPDQFDTEMNLYSSELLESVAMLKIIASDDRNGVIRLDTQKDNKTVLSADNTDKEKMESELYVSNFNGNDIKVSFNHKYFTDAISALDAEEIHIQLQGSMRPFIMQDSKDKKAIQLILPVRTY